MANLPIAPPLLKTKLHIPHRRPDRVSRSRLIQQLNERIQRKLTLFIAPAGYGKTNLASEWVNALRSEGTSNNRITWLSLEEADSEPVRFLSYVIASLQQVVPEIGVGALSLFEMAQSPPVTAVLNELINDIAGLDYHIMLVLDDYHVVGHPEIISRINYTWSLHRVKIRLYHCLDSERVASWLRFAWAICVFRWTKRRSFSLGP